MKINLKNTAGATSTRVVNLGRQLPFVTAVSLTRTAQDVKPALRAEMIRSFDRPTAFTLGSLYVKSATKSNLEARVWLKDDAGKGTPAARYLGPQIDGGGRRLKGMEAALKASGLMRAGQFAVPAAGAQLDGSGNVKRSQIVQILSQLKAQRSAGFESRATDSARSKRTVRKQGVTYFALQEPRRGLKPGIYLKRKFALGSAIRPVFLFVSSLNYKEKFDFHGVGHRVARERFRYHFSQEASKAIANAKLGRR